MTESVPSFIFVLDKIVMDEAQFLTGGSYLRFRRGVADSDMAKAGAADTF